MGLGPNGQLEWLTPLQKKQARTVDGFIIPEAPVARADEWGRWGIGASGKIEWLTSKRMDYPKDHIEREEQIGSDRCGMQDLPDFAQMNGLDYARREGVGLSDWRREWDTRPLGHLEWLARKFGDIRDGKMEMAEPDLISGQRPNTLLDYGTIDSEKSLNRQFHNAVRKSAALPSSPERVELPSRDMVAGNLAFT